MPLKITDTQNQSSLFSNDYVAGDFNSDRLKEDSIVLELPFGTANMKQWYFTGIRMAYSQWHYNKAAETEWKGALDVVTMYFNLKGKCSIKPMGMDKPLKYENQQRNIFYSDGGTAIVKNDELVTEVFIVQFTREAFIRLTKDINTILTNFANHVAEGKQVWLSDTNLPIDIDTDIIIKAILQCNYPDDLKKMFLLSKTIELLVLQAKTFAAATETKDAFIKSEYDKQRITFVKEVLMKNMQSPPNLSQLAIMAGINEYKLKKGFKEMFGVSVFGYLSDLRLNTAKQELLNKKKTISEIAYEMGYSSIQHFSAAFKKKFNISPRNL
ncbi:AraC family transcriptional regulator [Pedobacter heparinus]|uniref:helix-turn-helix domain-containing protein n=1 Tax=Pedobacter heparinus TaxID=984 RepID=UPI00292F50FA|nr:AraC family transcriptional regulator [Pedobacter heparinus]